MLKLFDIELFEMKATSRMSSDSMTTVPGEPGNALGAESRVHLIPQTPSLIDAHTRIRDRSSPRRDVLAHGRRVIRFLLEESFGFLPRDVVRVITPAGHTYVGARTTDDVCAVSVVRAGEALEAELWSIAPEVRIGKILIQRDHVTKQPSLHWAHLPDGIQDGHVLLLEPMLATGGSLMAALDVLNDAGVPDDRIIAVSMLSSPQGIEHVTRLRPSVRIVTSSIEERLDEAAYMVPGIGDFGDRWFGTDGNVTWL